MSENTGGRRQMWFYSSPAVILDLDEGENVLLAFQL